MIAAAIASAIPVLPLVASISVSPGLISPRSCARVIIDNAGRSFTEPAGLLPSNLARTTLLRYPRQVLEFYQGRITHKVFYGFEHGRLIRKES